MVSPLTLVAACVALAISTWYLVTMFFGRKAWDPRGKHCLVTGGSAGLGLSLGILLAKRGADVSIVARDQERLDKALELIEAARRAPHQVFRAYSFSIDSATEAEKALDAAAAAHRGRCPDALFSCAGKSRPGFWLEQSEAQLRQCMDETYWVQAWPALAMSKRMVAEGIKGKIVFVSSVLGYFSMFGYSTYSPGKFAIRGLAEALQSEFLLYGIGVHICFPGTIFSPGFIEENKVKPKITLKIEERDEGSQPEVVAINLLKGVEKGDFHITYDFISNTFRASTRGSSPGNSGFMSQIYMLIGMIGLPLWRRDVDKEVLNHKQEHYEYLHNKGLVPS